MPRYNGENYKRLQVEVAIRPDSPFWEIHSELDENDPLTILIKAEEGDEEAEELTRGFQFHEPTS